MNDNTDIIRRFDNIAVKARYNASVAKYFASIDTTKYDADLLSTLYFDVCSKYQNGDNIELLVRQSYNNIVRSVGYSKRECVFLSDVVNTIIIDDDDEEEHEEEAVFDAVKYENEVNNIKAYALSQKKQKSKKRHHKRKNKT